MPLGVGFLIVKRKVGGMREAPSVWGGVRTTRVSVNNSRSISSWASMKTHTQDQTLRLLRPSRLTPQDQ